MQVDKKISVASNCIAMITLFFLICSCVNYVEYTPIVLVVERGDHILKSEPSLLTPAHINAMKIILERYGEEYRVKEGKLYIKQSLQNDRDLLQNYTFKAEAYRKE